jgi:serine/threonine protein kinase
MGQQPGRLLGDRYRLRSTVGRGGMGTVWRAHDELLDRAVAVKEVLLPPGLSPEERDILYRRTFREARASARLNHPNVVTVHDVVSEDDRPWIVMELVPAPSLQDMLDERGTLAAAPTAEIGRQMLSALTHAHRAGILHRDVKPSNVLITEDGRAVLTDFGIAQMEGDATLTQTGLVMGSPAYIPPERVQGERAVPASDLWALGATLYTAVEGRAPYERPDAMAALAAALTEEVPPPRNAGPLRPVLDGLLTRRPADRMVAADAMPLLVEVARSNASLNRLSAALPLPGKPKTAETVVDRPTTGAEPVAETVLDSGSQSLAAQRPAPDSPRSAPAGGGASPRPVPDSPRSPAGGGPSSRPVPERLPPPRDLRGYSGQPQVEQPTRRVEPEWQGLYAEQPRGEARPYRPEQQQLPAEFAQQSWPLHGTYPAQHQQQGGGGHSRTVIIVLVAAIVIAIGLVVGALVLKGRLNSKASGSGAGPKVQYVSQTANGFTMDVPKTWTKDGGGSSSSVKWLGPDNDLIQVDTIPWTGTAQNKRDAFDTGARQSAGSSDPSFRDYQRQSLGSAQFAGTTAYDVDFTWLQNTTAMHSADRFLQVGGAYFAIYFRTTEAHWKSEQTVRQHIYSTFRLG